MKLKKNKDRASAEILQDNPEKIRLRRRQEKLRNDEIRAETLRTAIFKRRVREASLRKAPKTLRTKGYYRFTKDYPSEVSPDGFRENSPESKKLTAKQKFALSLLCIAVFCISFTVINIGTAISEKTAGEKQDPPVINEETALTGLRISPENFSTLSTEEIKGLLSDNGCNMAVIEFKSEYGYIYFDLNSSEERPADKTIPSAEAKLNGLRADGILCAAYISCFKDTVAASSLAGAEVKTPSGELFTDNNEAAWLNPCSEAAQSYILNLIAEAESYGFDYIFLDNASFPSDYSGTAPVFGEETDKNGIISDFLNKAIASSNKGNIVIMGDISGFTEISTIPDEKYASSLLSSAGNAFCLDMRKEHQNTPQLKSSEKFKLLTELPLAFILEAGSLAKDTLTQTKEASLLFAIIDRSLKDGINYVHHSGIKNVIIW